MIHLIVGNTGAGKTTYANKLKKELKGVVFSIDQWNNTLFLPDKKETRWFRLVFRTYRACRNANAKFGITVT